MRPLSKYQPYVDNELADEGYTVMRTPLVVSVGSYCAYCEAPLTVDAQVEHKLPKAVFDSPAHVRNWGNLLPACASCNNAKAAHPGRAASLLASYNQWVWPDASWSLPSEDATTYVRTTFGGSAQEIPDGARTAQLLTYHPGAFSTLSDHGKALVVDHPNAGVDPAGLWLVPNSAYFDASNFGNDAAAMADVAEALRATVHGMRLNRWRPDEPLKISDRRFANRTRIYDGAVLPAIQLVVAALEDYRTRVPADPQGRGLTGQFGVAMDPALLSVLRSVRRTVIATGHWSVWLWAMRRDLRRYFADLGEKAPYDTDHAALSAFTMNLRAYFWRMLVAYADADGRNRQGPDIQFLQPATPGGSPWQPDTVLPGTDLRRVPGLAWNGADNMYLGAP